MAFEFTMGSKSYLISEKAFVPVMHMGRSRNHATASSREFEIVTLLHCRHTISHRIVS